MEQQKLSSNDQLLKDIEGLINEINTDAFRKKLPDLCIKLIELAHIQWDAESYVIRSKAMLEMAIVEKKDEIKTNFEKDQDLRAEYHKDDKKWKRAKITIDELDNQAKMTQSIKDMINAKLANEEVAVRLKPLTKAYTERIQAIKFLDNQNKNFNSQQ